MLQPYASPLTNVAFQAGWLAYFNNTINSLVYAFSKVTAREYQAGFTVAQNVDTGGLDNPITGVAAYRKGYCEGYRAISSNPYDNTDGDYDLYNLGVSDAQTDRGTGIVDMYTGEIPGGAQLTSGYFAAEEVWNYQDPGYQAFTYYGGIQPFLSSLLSYCQSGSTNAFKLNAMAPLLFQLAGGDYDTNQDTYGTPDFPPKFSADALSNLPISITNGKVNVNLPSAAAAGYAAGDVQGRATLAPHSLDAVLAPPDIATDTAARATFGGMIRALFNRFYGEVNQTSAEQTVKNDAGTVVSTMTVSDDGTTATKTKSA